MPASLVTMSIANGTHISAPNRHIWVVTGPAGCGKTTVAEHLSRKLDVPYVEGDKVRFTAVSLFRCVNQPGPNANNSFSTILSRISTRCGTASH